MKLMRKLVLPLVLLVVGSLVFPEQAVSPKPETVGFWDGLGGFFWEDCFLGGGANGVNSSVNVYYNYTTYNFSHKGALAAPAGIGGRLSLLGVNLMPFSCVFSSGYSFNSVEHNGGRYHYHEFDPLLVQFGLVFWRFGLRGGLALTLLWERWLPDQGGAAHTNYLGLGLSYPLNMDFWLSRSLVLTAGIKPLFISRNDTMLLKHSFTVGFMFNLFYTRHPSEWEW